MAEDRLSQIYEDRMGANVGAAAVAYLGSQYEELKTPNSEARNKLADFLDNQSPELQEKICVLPIKIASVKEQMRNAQNIAEADAEVMQKHQYMYADINHVIERTMPTFVKWTQTLNDAQQSQHINNDPDYDITPEYGIVSNTEIVYMSQMVRNEHLDFSKDCDSAQADAIVKELVQNARAYKLDKMVVEEKIKDENGQERIEKKEMADMRTSFGDVAQFVEKHALQASQAMKVLGETILNYNQLSKEERMWYVELSEKFPQEVKVAAYVTQAREQTIENPESLQQEIRRPNIVLATRMLEENAVTPMAESVEKAMFAAKSLDIMQTQMKMDINLMTTEGLEYMKTAQKFGEAALIAVCTTADSGEAFEGPKDLMRKSMQSLKLMQYMHEDKFSQRRLNMDNLDNAVAHVSRQQKTFNAREMLKNIGYSLG